jgi:hypothetical protein
LENFKGNPNCASFPRTTKNLTNNFWGKNCYFASKIKKKKPTGKSSFYGLAPPTPSA